MDIPSSLAIGRRPVIGIPADFAPAPDTTISHPRWLLNETYVSAVYDLDGLPLILPVLPPEGDQLVTMLDGLILSGGGDIDPVHFGQPPHPDLGGVSPERDDLELRMFAAARQHGLPVLAICRGIQLINVAMGGTLIQDIPAQAPSDIQHRQHLNGLARDDVSHGVHLEPDSLLAGIYGASDIQTNSYHHQAIDRLADGLVITGRAGDDIIESVESAHAHDGDFLVGVQWHPETLYRRHTVHARPFQALLAAAAAFAERRTPVSLAR